ncbi:hypothetical protein IGI04_004870 [Brassica rapa subsp. trilocularis]|uniref:Uncharacterized protein n=1 Tax=Brassica rapa subsp. trilocularis TaxID=1813537 RepID=A0ABQ7NE50_BRACM|nr:hypothetical protein IGI04_004870 [Brassica rapa subsp. trilocularis]
MDDDEETMTATTSKREAEENRKEALLASTQSLQPNFNRSNVSQKQISKLQDLHKRRMKIKANSKKPKAKLSMKSRSVEDGESSKVLKESTTSSSSTTLEQQTVVTAAPMKPQKLYWGLDTKERWERKANM